MRCLRCLDEVPPFDGETARDMIRKDLGRPPAQIFRRFDDRPLSAASIGQVHALRAARRARGGDQAAAARHPRAHDHRPADHAPPRAARCERTEARQERQPHRRRRTTSTPDHVRGAEPGARGLPPGARSATTSAPSATTRASPRPRSTGTTAGPHMICMERMSGVPMDEFDAIRERGRRRRADPAPRREGVDRGGDGPRPVPRRRARRQPLGARRRARRPTSTSGSWASSPTSGSSCSSDLFFTSMIDGDFTRIARAFKRVGRVLRRHRHRRGGRRAHADGLRSDARRRHRRGQPGRRLQVDRQMMERLRRGQPAGAGARHQAAPLLRALRQGARARLALARDLFLVKNIFPDEAAKKAADARHRLPRLTLTKFA